MAISTYSELKSAVADYLNRDDLDARVPDFIRAAHDVIVRDVRIPLAETSTTATITASVGSVAVPTGLRSVMRMWVTASPLQIIAPATSEQIQRARTASALNGDGVTTPQFFVREGSSFVFWPIPTADTGISMQYLAGPVLLSADGDTNVILTRYPFLYLHGALGEAWRYLRNPTEEAKSEAMFRDMVASINAQEQADRFSGGSLQMTTSARVV